jgi:hypothetical protein
MLRNFFETIIGNESSPSSTRKKILNFQRGWWLIFGAIICFWLVSSVSAQGEVNRSAGDSNTPKVENLNSLLVNSTFALDWRIFMAATTQWWRGENPYGVLPPDLGIPDAPAYGFHKPGAFAYPPTALTWLAIFLPFGSVSYYLWTLIQLGGWWLIIRRQDKLQIALISWAPLLVHIVLGQNTLAIVLVLWAATLSNNRRFLWGIALAWTLTKPQVAILPILWLLWQDRNSIYKYRLWLGIVLGTAFLALPPSLLTPEVWGEWFISLQDYRLRIQHTSPWEGIGVLILLLAAYLWFRKFQSNQKLAGWQWWLTAALFPQTGVYSSVVLLPLLRPQQTYWSIAGIVLAGLLIGPATPITLPILLSGQILATWLICGGPKPRSQKLPQ